MARKRVPPISKVSPAPMNSKKSESWVWVQVRVRVMGERLVVIESGAAEKLVAPQATRPPDRDGLVAC